MGRGRGVSGEEGEGRGVGGLWLGRGDDGRVERGLGGW